MKTLSSFSKLELQDFTSNGRHAQQTFFNQLSTRRRTNPPKTLAVPCLLLSSSLECQRELWDTQASVLWDACAARRLLCSACINETKDGWGRADTWILQRRSCVISGHTDIFGFSSQHVETDHKHRCGRDTLESCKQGFRKNLLTWDPEWTKRARLTLTSVSSASRKEYMYLAAVAVRSRGPLNSRSGVSASSDVPCSVCAASSLLHAHADRYPKY